MIPRRIVAPSRSAFASSASWSCGWPTARQPPPGIIAAMSKTASSASSGEMDSSYPTWRVMRLTCGTVSATSRKPSASSSRIPHGANHSPRTRSRKAVSRSSTSTSNPARARTDATAEPPSPPPTTITSNCSSCIATPPDVERSMASQPRAEHRHPSSWTQRVRCECRAGWCECTMRAAAEMVDSADVP